MVINAWLLVSTINCESGNRFNFTFPIQFIQFTFNKTKECECVNRADSDVYSKIKFSKPVEDSCWFIPCTNNLKRLFPAVLNTRRVQVICAR